MESSPAQSLEQVCREAHETVRGRGRPVLAHHSFPLGGGDPLAILRGLEQPHTFRFYWERPGHGFALAAGGTAQGFRLSGPARFRKMAAALEAILATAVHGTGGGSPTPPREGGPFPLGPCALGGFSFFDELRDPHWEGFQAAEMVVPAWMVVSCGREAVGMVTLLATPGRQPGALQAEMEGLRTRLMSAARQEAGEGFGRAGPLFPALEGENGHRDWLGMVSAAAADIRAGKLAKVVLARAVELGCAEPPSPFPVLDNLRRSYPDCYTFLVDPGRGQFFLGASPERLVKAEGSLVQLGALAGTAARGEHQAADEALADLLLQGPKERLEHDIVVRAILEAVADLGQVERPANPEVLRFNNLQHLFTPLTLRLRDPVGLLSLVERLHPTPAVGAYPRESGLKKLRGYEGFERGWYAAPVGWMDARGDGEFAVALRSALFTGTQVRAFAGNGILADSDPEREYLETQLKLRPILAAFGNE